MHLNKTVMVTGAAGFIGKSLIKRLIKEKIDFIPVDNFSSGDEHPGFEIEKFDVTSQEFIDKFRYSFISDIFHFASPCSVIQYNIDPVICSYQTIESLFNIIKLCRYTHSKIYYPSSGTVYGNLNKKMKELDPTVPVNLYGQNKLACEHLLFLSRRFNLDSMIFRIFAGYGPEENHKGNISSAITLFLNDIKNNKRPVVWGNGEQTRDFVYIDNIVEVFYQALNSNLIGTFNIGSGKGTSFNKIIEILNKELKKDLEPKYIPKPSLYLENTLADISKMKGSFNVNPYNIEEGISIYLKDLEN